METCCGSALGEFDAVEARVCYLADTLKHSENPIIRAVAKGTCNTKRDSPLINSAALNTSLPNNQPIPNVFQPGVSIIGTPPVANASQPDDSIADTPMPDAPMDQATSELLTSTPPSRAWVVTSASATPSSRIPSLGLKSHQVRCSNIPCSVRY